MNFLLVSEDAEIALISLLKCQHFTAFSKHGRDVERELSLWIGVQENTAELRRDVFEATFHERGFAFSSLANAAVKFDSKMTC